jgi:hypothetical protein
MDQRYRCPGERAFFISYSHADTDTGAVQGLAAALRQRGYSPWVDRNDLKAQENWKDAVDQAMREAQAAVFLIDGSIPFVDRYQEYEWRAAIGASSDALNGRWFPCYSTALSGQASSVTG